MDGFIHTIKVFMWRTRYTEKLMIIHTGITPSTMYTWIESTDKNLKPNKANTTTFKNLML